MPYKTKFVTIIVISELFIYNSLYFVVSLKRKVNNVKMMAKLIAGTLDILMEFMKFVKLSDLSCASLSTRRPSIVLDDLQGLLEDN